MFNDLAAGSITTDDGVQAGGSVRAQRRGASTVRPAPTLHLVACARKFGFLDHERLVPAAIRAGLID